jgi:protoporphyrinogen oxidase
VKIGILGGGLTGLTLAVNLKKEYEVLEKDVDCGGLCRSLQEEGFTFDYGGAHIIFSRNQDPVDFMKDMLGDNLVRGRRNNKVFYKGVYVKYPFENGLSDLPKQDNFKCLYYYLKNDYPAPTNFKEWIYYTFGKGIAEKYLIPYNEKIWNYDAAKMSMHWMEGRVPRPPVEDVIKSAIGIETEGYTHQLYFFYPKTGGIQSLIKSMEKKAPDISRNYHVKKVAKKGQGWVVSDGKSEREFDKVVATIPVADLVDALDDVPQEIITALNSLRYNSLICVMLGINAPRINDLTAVYIPDKEFLPNRIGFPMNFSTENVPQDKSSLVAEITCNEGDRVYDMSDREITDHVVNGLHERKIIDKKDVCYKKVMRTKYAYVVYDLDYLKNVKIVRDYIQSTGIILCGRFAEFEYLNMDVCIERAIKISNLLNQL